MKYCLILMSMFLFLKVHAQEEKTQHFSKLRTKSGYATYYAKKFEGRKTTSGEKYRSVKLTAAHRTLPFGTIVTVTNLNNGKSVDVEVNDRGPFTQKYIIDISEGAAKLLGFYKKGHSRVEISYDTSGV
ncbi:rare lipoprotein A [Pedobacter sp. CG_S7]|uniref:septal ring lytic transglycosylase RlpA family protein n=1 Tax=Pedobacter sp. CG_S7 TaxID=3143930 RepID=UPI003391E3FA